jgi:hypothetical protein
MPGDVLQQSGIDIPFVNNVTYLSVTCERRMTWRLHVERTVASLVHVYKDFFFIQKWACKYKY